MAETLFNGNGNGKRGELGAWITRVALIGLTGLAVWTGQRIVGQLDQMTGVIQGIDGRLIRVETWIDLQRGK